MRTSIDKTSHSRMKVDQENISICELGNVCIWNFHVTISSFTVNAIKSMVPSMKMSNADEEFHSLTVFMLSNHRYFLLFIELKWKRERFKFRMLVAFSSPIFSWLVTHCRHLSTLWSNSSTTWFVYAECFCGSMRGRGQESRKQINKNIHNEKRNIIQKCHEEKNVTSDVGRLSRLLRYSTTKKNKVQNLYQH